MGDSIEQLSPISYADKFDEMCPVCMNWGMSYDEFWHGEPERINFYKKAYDMKKEIRNNELWLQGFYIYRALMATSGYSFGKKNDPPNYYEEPLAITDNEKKIRKERELEREKKEALAFMENAMKVIKPKK